MEDIKRFRDLTEKVLSNDEKDFTGIGRQLRNRRELDEQVVGYKIDPSEKEESSLVSENDTDEDLVFVFDEEEDAVDMYSFFVESKLLDVGEIVFRNINDKYTVSFAPSVMVNKPEMIQAALLTYEDRLYADTEEDVKTFEDVIESITNLLEAATKTSGAPKRKKGMGNPFHDKKRGRFTGAKRHAKEKGGSWAIGKKKLKFTGKGKTKEGGLLAKYGSTKHPCGRAARKKGKDVRCWDGATMEDRNDIGVRISRIMKGKKWVKEDISIDDFSFLMEMRAKYNRF